ncbi:MAG: chromate transporter [Ruminococcaceae bacterium]|nr:chromate transporter [Oscillospiraceae bacterium]
MKGKLKLTLSLFITFFKIGLFTFGGGYAMISQIKESVVEKNEWLSEDELLEIIAIAEATPGPIAINMATFVGYKKCGVLGSVFSTLGVVLPSFIIIFIISMFAESFKKNEYVKFAFLGIKAAVAFLILKTGVNMFIKMKKKPYGLIAFSIVFISMILFELFAVSFSAVYFILLGGIAGIVIYSILNIGEKEKEK